MRFGVIVPMSPSDGGGRMPTWPEIRSFARHAEDVGLDSLWVYDHFVSAGPGQPPEGQHEAWTILSALAASTSRAELGQLVLCTPFRSPGLLGKMAVSADEVSGGRVTLGLGAGWYDPEFDAFGYPRDHRVDRFEEAVRIIVGLLAGATVSMDGRHHQVLDAVLDPAPSRRIPILLAAKGPRMLGLTARYADAWNTAWFGRPDDRLLGRLADLDAALDAEGRDPRGIRRTVGMLVRDPESFPAGEGGASFDGGVGELAEAFQAYEELGIDDLIIVLEPMTERSLDRLAEAVAVWRG